MAGYVIPYADPITAEIDLLRRTWDDLMTQRKRFTNRSTDWVTGEVRSPYIAEVAEQLRESEERVQKKLISTLKKHPMADWLTEAKTMGARTATILATIKNPHRFPSQKCSNGCHLLPVFEVGAPCPCETTPKDGDTPEPCAGVVEAPRQGTGCRSLWHMIGMYPITDSKGKVRLARKVKGQQSTYNAAAKMAVMMPQGIGQQFFMQHSRYEEVYYREKARLAALHPDKAAGWLDGTARVIAAKAWAGDMLMEWKKRVPLGSFAGRRVESEARDGERLPALVLAGV